MEAREGERWEKWRERSGGDTDEAGTATMTSRALNVGMADGWVVHACRGGTWEDAIVNYFMVPRVCV